MWACHGETSRDFTFVENAVQANIRTLLTDKNLKHNVFNVACGDQISLNSMILLLQDISDVKLNPIFSKERNGDIKHSKASIDKIRKFCDYNPTISFIQGLELVYEWYLKDKKK
jgi:UDP-N-acetylglucosamine 4-epimerase